MDPSRALAAHPVEVVVMRGRWELFVLGATVALVAVLLWIVLGGR